MKKILIFGLFLISTIAFSQVPQFLNYQGIARNSSGTIITTAIGIKFEILQGSASGTVVYDETNNILPSSAGVFTTAIGSGAATTGTFSAINWAAGPYYIKVSIDPAGGTSYSTVGTSQLLSVPYALYAEKAGNAQTFTAGNGITINSGTITNSSPNQTVNISGSGVTGSYPNYTVSSGTTPTAGAGISIVSGTITNTAPDQTVTISGATGTYPNFTVTSSPSTTITSGNSNISVSGASPSYTISSVPTLSLSGAQLSISNGNTVTLPTGTTYTNGAGISLTSGTIITNTAPNQTVTVSSGTNVTVNGAYPNYTVNANPTLSLSTNVLSISGGNAVTLPAAPIPTAGIGISIIGGTITNTAPNQTVNVTGGGVSGTYPNYTVTSAPATTVTAGNNIVVNGAAPSYTVNTPTYSLNFSTSSNALLTNGTSTTTVSIPQPTLTLGGAGNNVISAGSNSITIANYASGNGLSLSGAFPNFTLSTSSTGTNVAWNTLGNVGTNATSNFIGTTDNVPLNFRVNNQKAGRIDHLLANAFFGYQAGNANTTGIFNSAFGNQTLLSNTTGSYNAAFGTNALYFNNTGNNNSATGYQPLFSNTTGNYNTANGFQSLYSNSSGNNNTALGALAGNNNNGSGNVFLGYSAGSTANSSNKLYIANSNSAVPLIFGDFTSGYVGLGTNTPGAMLDIVSNSFNVLNLGTTNGNSNINVDAFPTGAGVLQLRVPTANGISFVTSNIGRMLIDASGNVGIGTTVPSYPLHVQKGVGSIFAASIENTNNTGWGLEIRTAGTSATQNALEVYSGGISKFLVREDGNVGIGTTTPSGKLEVAGNVAIPGANSYRYLSPKTKYAKIFSAELNSANPSLYQGRNDDGFGSGVINGLNSMWAQGGAAGNPAYFIAQIQLPDSAVITGLSAQVVKNGGSLQSIVELWRTDGAGYLANTAQLIASCSTSFSGGGVQYPSAGSVNASYNVVNNSGYVYFIRYTGEQNTQNLRFHLATVTYQIYRSDQ